MDRDCFNQNKISQSTHRESTCSCYSKIEHKELTFIAWVHYPFPLPSKAMSPRGRLWTGLTQCRFATSLTTCSTLTLIGLLHSSECSSWLLFPLLVPALLLCVSSIVIISLRYSPRIAHQELAGSLISAGTLNWVSFDSISGLIEPG